MIAEVLTDITPNRHDDVNVVVPDYGVHEHNKIVDGNPYSVTPYRKAKLAYLGYER